MTQEQNDSRGEARQSFFAKQQLIDSVRTAFQLLAAVIKNATLYPESHPILLVSADKLKSKMGELLVGRKEAPFYLLGGELFFEKISIPVEQGLALLMEQFTGRDVGSISFKPGVTTEELIRFAAVINKDTSVITGEEGIAVVLIRAKITHIEVRRSLLIDKESDASLKAGKQKPSEVFRDAVGVIQEMVQSVQKEKTGNARKMNGIVQTMVDHILENRDAFLGLTNIKMYDEYTFAHSVNVSILAVSLGTFLSFDKTQIAALGTAGLMHDIGKVRVPHEIINKAGKLTDEEWEAVKRHPAEGALLLAGTGGVSKLAVVAAFEHHQQGDRGYPVTNDGMRQHPFSQIISVVDAYDAITAPRVYYRAQTSADEAVRIMLRKRGAPFNPVLVNAFVKMVGVFPVGTIVQLNTGEIAMVRHQTNDLMRPRVLILTRFDGSEKEFGTLASLMETSKGKYVRSIRGTIDPWQAGIDPKLYLE